MEPGTLATVGQLATGVGLISLVVREAFGAYRDRARLRAAVHTEETRADAAAGTRIRDSLDRALDAERQERRDGWARVGQLAEAVSKHAEATEAVAVQMRGFASRTEARLKSIEDRMIGKGA